MDLYIGLKLLWWVLLGVLLMGLAIMVGMDMGVGTLLRFVGKNDGERRQALNVVGPHWDGNQVWFILGGGAIFAAWPTLYATSFSVFYIVMILLLFSMILRPVAFEYRSKVAASKWRDSWDWVFLVSGFLPMFVYGAAIGNILEGVGFHFGWDGQYYQTESFIWYLLNPFAILSGLLAVSMSVYQGGAMLMLRGTDPIASRARNYASTAGIIAIVLFIIGGFMISGMTGYSLISGDPGMPANAVSGQVVHAVSGAWLDNYAAQPILWIIPLLAIAGMLFGALMLRANKPILGWWLGAIAWIGILGTVATSMFPFLMPSSENLNQSLTIWNASGSRYNLIWMTIFTAIFVPTILAYTTWCFRVMRGKVNPPNPADDHAY
ncbi:MULTISPECIES: cytochrome d ubiquinol oxidase subunit II [Acidithiobacillus]|uniref:cytochrome d ubiquinol oxidase subunit II n=1 Tax=Acidithiobacillus TaxID=119977 RepID=UPI0004E20677|nr:MULTISPECIES: cytochrome d ubiquinol oxidase subunit II [Acidithiobacillus]MBU2742438.1 cytochrome d ubiquinol oxidase subunit II [Acidithiobacillus albertensis]MDA8176962.1 cytochrome d ubiquinol oxidase subunit II [Acidithiobacillus sp.]